MAKKAQLSRHLSFDDLLDLTHWPHQENQSPDFRVTTLIEKTAPVSFHRVTGHPALYLMPQYHTLFSPNPSTLTTRNRVQLMKQIVAVK